MSATLEEEEHKAKHKVCFQLIPTHKNFLICSLLTVSNSLAYNSNIFQNTKTLVLFWIGLIFFSNLVL